MGCDENDLKCRNIPASRQYFAQSLAILGAVPELLFRRYIVCVLSCYYNIVDSDSQTPPTETVVRDLRHTTVFYYQPLLLPDQRWCVGYHDVIMNTQNSAIELCYLRINGYNNDFLEFPKEIK